MVRRGNNPKEGLASLNSVYQQPAGIRCREDPLCTLTHLALMQIGHSRRIAEPPLHYGPTLVFGYVCETGFEHRRQSHHWMVVARHVAHGCSRATLTVHDWLVAAAWAPACREIRLPPHTDGSGADGRFVAVVEDDEEWDKRLRGGLVDWLDQQPAERSWEIVPGMLVGYQAARPGDEALLQLKAAVDELATLLANG